MDADGTLMEQPMVQVVELALGWVKRRFCATHDSFHFKNQQSSLDNHQSIPPRPITLCVLASLRETLEPGQRLGNANRGVSRQGAKLAKAKLLVLENPTSTSRSRSTSRTQSIEI